MFGINEVKAMISASDARAMRQHSEVMEELHDLGMQIETLYDVLGQTVAELAPKSAQSAVVTKSAAKPSVPVTKPNNVKGKSK